MVLPTANKKVSGAAVSGTARLLITCPDRSGIVAAVTSFLYRHGANITCLDQHSSDPEGGELFMRLEFQISHLDMLTDELEREFGAEVAEGFFMRWRIAYAAEKKRIAVCVSRHDHALLELLWLASRGDLGAEIAMVISNHEDLRGAVESFGIPYHCVPVQPETKAAAEEQLLSLLEADVDLLVLARYMQVLSSRVVDAFPNRIINIHHSFLPAFAGADPYRQAYLRGVKIIGATAHYVTVELDQGPIIEQDITRISHRHGVAYMRTLGRDLERQVLARAVRWHLEDRVIVDGGKTVVFS